MTGAHFAFQPAQQPLTIEVDFVVVGSGAGGATAAVVLARAGKKVAIVESGAWRDPHDYPSSTYGAFRDLFDNWGTSVTLGRAFWPIVQGSAVGGSTVINSAICVRTPEDIFTRWRNEHGVGGAHLAKELYRIQDQLEKELNAEEVPPQSRGRSNELAMLAADRMGMDSHVMVRYARNCEGTGQCLQGCRKGRKQSTNLNYVPEVLERGGIVLSCAPVDKVIFSGNTAVGVVGKFRHPQTREKGAKFTVRARQGVIVAASATKSAPLLQYSGVKSRALGKYFRSHPGTGVFGIYDEPVDMNTGATQGWASTQYRNNPGLKLETLSIPLEMVASRLSGGGSKLIEKLTDYRHIAMWVHAVRAESVGRIITLPGGASVVNYTLNREDMLRFRQGLQIVAKMHFEAGAKEIIPGIFGLPYKLTADQLSLLEDAPLDPRAYVAILSHLFGGCVMGSDPNTAVCDGDGKVYGYQQLYIADASAIPTNLGVNPQHTIMALAWYWAEKLSN